MTSDRLHQNDLLASHVQNAIAELSALIRLSYPDATFAVEAGSDPDDIYLIATVDLEDTDEVVDAYIDRLLDLQVVDGLPLHVLPVRPPHRIAAMPRARPDSAQAAAVAT